MRSVEPMNQDVQRTIEGFTNDRPASGIAAPRLLVAVLAAGVSRRLGRPKQLVDIGGESLLRRQCRMAIASGVGPVVAILGCRADDCELEVANLPLTCRFNPTWTEGLASSIREAVRAADDACADGLLLVHVDQYRLAPSDLVALLTAWSERPLAACAAAYGECTGPPAIFGRRHFTSLRTLEGDVGARRILGTLAPEELRRIQVDHASVDLDEPDQLADLAAAVSGDLSR